jgi:peroxiredoxin
MIPDIPFHTLDGKSVHLSSYKGKILLIDFWTTYCAPCIAQFPALKSLYASLSRSEFEILGVSLDEPQGSKSPDTLVRSFIKGKQIPWPVVLGEKGIEGEIAKTFNITGIPITIVIDRTGRIFAIEGPNTSVYQTEKSIRELLTKSH